MKQLTFHRRVQMLPRILLLIIYKIVAQAVPSFIHTRKSSGLKRVEVGEQADPESLTCYNFHVIVMSTFSQQPCAHAQETASFSGAIGNAYFFFVLKPIRLKQTLPGTYPQGCSGTESRAPCSQGGRNSPGTSRSGRHRCYPGSWCSGHRGRWNGIVQGQSNILLIAHCSHRLSAKHRIK